MNFRRPLLLLALLLVAVMGGWWLPAPNWTLEEPGQTSGSLLTGLLVAFAGPGLPVLALGLIGAWSAGGAASLRSGARYLLGVAREGEHLQAHTALACASRTMVSGGLVIGLLGGTAAFLLMGEALQSRVGANPHNVAYIVTWSMLAPITALGVGRVVLGVAADAAAVDGGAPERRTFGRRDDYMLLLYVLSPIMVFTVVLWPFSENG